MALQPALYVQGFAAQTGYSTRNQYQGEPK